MDLVPPLLWAHWSRQSDNRAHATFCGEQSHECPCGTFQHFTDILDSVPALEMLQNWVAPLQGYKRCHFGAVVLLVPQKAWIGLKGYNSKWTFWRARLDEHREIQFRVHMPRNSFAIRDFNFKNELKSGLVLHFIIFHFNIRMKCI